MQALVIYVELSGRIMEGQHPQQHHPNLWALVNVIKFNCSPQSLEWVLLLFAVSFSNYCSFEGVLWCSKLSTWRSKDILQGYPYFSLMTKDIGRFTLWTSNDPDMGLRFNHGSERMHSYFAILSWSWWRRKVAPLIWVVQIILLQWATLSSLTYQVRRESNSHANSWNKCNSIRLTPCNGKSLPPWLYNTKRTCCYAKQIKAKK